VASDVRMKGFRDRSAVEDVLRLLRERIAPLPAEDAPLREAAWRVLAREVRAERDVPGFDRSAMDGYALRGESTFGASPTNPLPFRVVGESLPGRPHAGRVEAWEAVRIMTGAAVPDGADAVLPAEEADEKDRELRARAAVPPGRHIGRRGEDIRAGSVVLEEGRVLRPQDLGVLSSLGVGRIGVLRRPRVGIVVTGDELLPAGSPPEREGFRIADASSPMLEALVLRDGGVPVTPAIVEDDREAMRRAVLDAAAGCDAVLLTGASSVGAEDHLPQVLSEEGELAVHGVALRPASPAGIGFLDGVPLFLLPGNPVSSLCAYEFFAGPAVRRLGGRSMQWPHRTVSLPVGRKIISAVGRVDYARVRVSDGEVEPVAVGGSGVLTSTTRADGVVVVPGDLEGYVAGEIVTVHLYDS